jgi:hypothetical protein
MTGFSLTLPHDTGAAGAVRGTRRLARLWSRANPGRARPSSAQLRELGRDPLPAFVGEPLMLAHGGKRLVKMPLIR